MSMEAMKPWLRQLASISLPLPQGERLEAAGAPFLAGICGEELVQSVANFGFHV